ncbi:EAL domain-containing protein [Duganella sp. FT92W]|uniref:EAL domain-containing protein n=1 Tax=Pseudoduganella rivuli TaxID=2666085 RepID=A0A7X2LRG6_9BURK|nr:EAL domain-containing protein [Pseudoduganella rivuli]
MAKLRKRTEIARSNAYLRFRRRLLAGLCLMALLATALVAWQIRASTLERQAGLQRQTQHFVRGMEAHVKYAIQFVDLTLIGFANTIKVLPVEQTRSEATMRALLTSPGDAFNHDFWITFIDANGKAIATTSSFPLSGTDYSDRDYFAELKNGTARGLFVSGPTSGRVSKQRIFILARRVEGPDGQFMGVITAPLDATRFANVFENARIAQDVTIALIHRNGRVIARAPNFDTAFNTDLSDTILFRSLAESPVGSYQVISKIDKLPRIFSYRAMDNLPLIVAVGSSDLDALWFSGPAFVVGTSGLALLLVLMVLSGHFALQSYAKVEDREARYRLLYASSREMEEKFAASEARLRLIADNLPALVTYVDCDQRYTFTNRRFEEVFNLPPGGALGRTVQQMIGPEAYALSARYLQRALLGESVHFERPLQTRDGVRWDAITYVPDFGPDKQVRGLFVMAENITERRKNNESMQLAALMYQNSSEGMMVTDAEGLILSVNPAFTRISGYTEAEVVGHWAYELTSGRQDYEFFRKMRNAIRNTGQWEGEVWHQNKHGEHYLVALRFDAVFDQNGEAYRRVALFSDITKKKASEELIWRQANFDTLTGLPNRRMFAERLRQEMKKSDRAQLPMALVFIDLDGFKEVNDTLGHDMGDVLLKQVADRLSHCVRGTDAVARLGGDEFTVILAELNDPPDVLRIAQEILKTMSAPIQLGPDIVHISASLGITFYPDDARDADTLLKNADQAMYTAKQQGRNRFNYFAPFMQEATRARLILANEMRDALMQNQFRVLYQPVMELSSGKLVKAEALVRWQHPTRGLLCPSEFIPVAEHTGAIVGIGDWVFRQAAQTAKRMQVLHDKNFQVAVNGSICQFLEGGFNVAEWLDYLAELRLAPNSIIVEVTESLLLEADHTVVHKLQALHHAGIALSLDDFGTGYCSVAFLKRYALDFLKIDPSFLMENDAGADLCEAVIALAHKLGIRVIAEGVENQRQQAQLQAAGCDFGQGYVFSRPITSDELDDLLSSVDKPINIHRTACE